MKTKVGITHEIKRRLPWLIYWWSPPDDDGKQRRRSKSFRYRRGAVAFQAEKQSELNSGKGGGFAEDVSLGRLLEEFATARLTPERFQIVQENWRRCRAGEPFGAGEARRPWQNADMVHNVLRNAKADLRRAGVELSAPFTLHTFRKAFAQNHADAGTSPRTLAKLLGHSNAQMVTQYYNRVTDANEREAAATMDRLFAAEFHQSSTGAQEEGVA